MAKRKGIPKIAFVGIGGVAVAGVLVAVFVFGIGVPNTAPQFLDCSTPGAMLNTGCESLTPLVINEIEDPTISILCVEGFIRVGNGCVPIDPSLPPPNTIECMTGSTDPDCLLGIDQPEEPPITSDNSTTTQVCDELDISCGTSTLSLTTLLTKIDSQGNKIFTTDTLQLSGLSFFIEEGTSIDYSTGFIELEAKALSSENLGIVGTGLLDVLINNQTILTDLILFSIDGKACETEPCPVESCDFEEECNFRFDTDSVFGVFSDIFDGQVLGTTSPSYKFSFEEHFDKFPDSQVSTLEFVIKSLDFTLEDGKKYGESQFSVFTMQIDKDPNQLVIVNEEGIIEKIFPTDTLLTYANGGQTYYDGLNCRSYWSRAMGTIEIFNSEDELLASANLPGTTCSRTAIIKLTVTLTRDETYRLVHTPNIATDPTSSTFFDETFTTPKSQKNYALQCYRSQLDGFYCNYPSTDGSEIIRVGTCGACQ